MEYVFFILEIISAFIFYYAWGKLKPDIHQKMAWIYAVSAWMSLVIITGITAFMLNPGDWRNDFWRAWANPQTVPQIFARTGASLLLATLYVYLHASFRVGASSLREVIARRSAKAAMLGALLITAGGAGWYVALPESAKAALTGAAALTILTALIFVLTIVVFFMFYFGPYRNPGWLSPGFAILFFIIGLIVTGAAEFVREAVRKPYVIYGEVYSHNVYPTEIPGLQRDGFLEGGVWTKYFVRQNFSSLIAEDATIDENRIPQLPLSEQRKLGYAVYLYHCGACHDTVGHSGLQELLRGWQPEMIDQLIVKLDRFHFFMPPWSGTAPEAGALRAYLETLLQPHPILESSYKEKETAHVP
ncbi:MAG: cytochrome ubiquinol oxidase subunit I [Candidatus Omnitrophica bacterium]|nr:cytochrome ubiquinol oxidase subunit I [Candidatus Omnitrophota bacterium]